MAKTKQIAAAVAPALSEDQRETLVLTHDQRKQLLGRLAEFELALLNLPPREQAFVLAFVTDPTNATRAAERAGCPEKTAGVQAAKMLATDRVAHAVALGNLIREDRTMVTADRTIHELAIIAYADVNMFEPRGRRIGTVEGVPSYMTRALQSAEITEVDHYADVEKDGNVERVVTHTTRKIKYRLWSKPEALRLLALYQKLISNALIGQVVVDNRQVHHHEWSWGNKKLTF